MNTTDSTSSSLLAKVKARDQEGSQRLVQLYERLVQKQLRKAGILDENDQDDVFQNVFCSVTNGIDKFQRQRTGSFRKWLRAIVRSKVMDYFRRRKKQNRVGKNTTDCTRTDNHKFQDSLAKQEVSYKKFQEAQKIIQPMFEPQTWKVWLMLNTGKPPRRVAEVAKELGMTPDAVRQIKSRVSQRLRTVMEELD